jgi:hypothetical protein
MIVLQKDVGESMELKAKITDAGVIYLPNEIRQSFGRYVKLIPNAVAVVIFPRGAALDAVAKSLEIIQLELRLRMELAAKRDE